MRESFDYFFFLVFSLRKEINADKSIRNRLEIDLNIANKAENKVWDTDS